MYLHIASILLLYILLASGGLEPQTCGALVLRSGTTWDDLPLFLILEQTILYKTPITSPLFSSVSASPLNFTRLLLYPRPKVKYYKQAPIKQSPCYKTYPRCQSSKSRSYSHLRVFFQFLFLHPSFDLQLWTANPMTINQLIALRRHW